MAEEIKLHYYDEETKPLVTNYTEDGGAQTFELSSLREIQDIVDNENSERCHNRLISAIKQALPPDEASAFLSDDNEEELMALHAIYATLEESLLSMETPINYPLLFFKAAMYDLHMGDMSEDEDDDDEQALTDEEILATLNADNSSIFVPLK